MGARGMTVKHAYLKVFENQCTLRGKLMTSDAQRKYRGEGKEPAEEDKTA